MVPPAHKPSLLLVGAFPPPQSRVVGGVVSSCSILLNSSFSSHYDLRLVDSTQISNPPPPFVIRLILALRRFVVFLCKLFSGRPDALLVFASSGSSLFEKCIMCGIARLCGIPSFLFPRHGALIDQLSSSYVRRLLILPILRYPTYFLCQGPSWQRFAVEVVGFSRSFAPLIPNWTATKQMLDIGLSRTLPGSLDRPTLLFLGWLEEKKGIFELLESVNSLSQSFNFRLLIAGRGHAESRARSYVDSCGLADKVQFCGWVDGTSKQLLLQSADIMILPSWAEGFPNSIIEAMSAKVAVIASSVGNVSEMLVDGQHAILVPPRDVPSLTSAISCLLSNDSLRRIIAESGFVHASTVFSVDNNVSKLVSVIDSAVTGEIL